MICFARELHGVTVVKLHVSIPWCVRFAAQIISRSHRGTDGMTGYRRAYGRSRMPRRYVPWSEKVFYLEPSKRKVQVEAKWHEGIFLGIKDESEIAVVGAPHGIVFARSIRRVSKEDSGDGMLFNTIRGAPWELQPRAEGGVVNRLQLDVQAAIPERQAPPPTVGEQLPRRVRIRRSVELTRYGYTDRCIGSQHARLGLKPADHNEECRARIVRNMTADDDLNQRVQIAQNRTVGTTPPEARTGERDSVPEPARKKVRFAERVEEQTLEGTVTTNSPSTSSSSSSSSTSDSSSSPTAIATLMQVDESNQDSSKRQKITDGADMELEGPVMESERDRFQRYSDCDFLMHVKQNADVYFDRIFLMITGRENL